MKATALLASLPLALLPVGLSACQRHAEVRDEQASVFKPPPMVTANVRELDSGLGTDAFPVCATRPFGNCIGAADLPCDFSPWARETARLCYQKTGCKTNGTIEMKMSGEGCVVGVAMDQPNDDIVQCIVKEVGYVRCPCGGGSASHFFGIGNAGCRACEKEFACTAGFYCRDGQCIPADAGAGDGGI